jgi:hypothetical protein
VSAKENSAAKNYEFEKKQTADFAGGGRASAIKFAAGCTALRLSAYRGRPEVIAGRSNRRE